jgi:hypothetical protein
MKLGAGIGPVLLDFGSRGHFSTSPFVSSPPCRSRFRLAGNPESNAMQPTSERFRFLDRSRLLGKNQERRLRRIVGVVFLAEDLAADEKDHRRMPLDQRRECSLGRLTGARDKSGKQLAISE